MFFLACKNKFYEYFAKSSNVELKRQLLKFVARTFYINGGKVEITLRSPFNWMQKTALSDGFEKWRRV